MRIHQNDIGDVLEFLPETMAFTPQIEWDILICTLGFEERTHKILDELLSGKEISNKKLILIKYPTNKKENEDNQFFFQKAKDKSIEVFELEYDRSNFFQKFNVLTKDLFVLHQKVVFDVSTCSSYLFYPIFKTLIEADIELLVAYCEAEFYYPSREEWKTVEERARSENQLFVKSWDEADFQSIGVDDVYNSNLFAEMNPGNKPSILVAVPNFNSIRMQSIKEKDFEINKTESNNIKWLIGLPPSEENKWRAEALLKTNTLEAIPADNLDYISTLNYKEIIKSLESIWVNNKYTTHISIGSLGSKMQHLGTFLFVYLHPDVGLWLAEPREFKAKSYSLGFGNIYQINFGATASLRNKLSRYLQFEWER